MTCRLREVRLRHYLLAGAMAAHGALVLCGAFNLAPWLHWGMAREFFVMHGDFTGARYSFGFFAPGVPNAVIAELTLKDRLGRAQTETLGGGTRELDHRMTTMMTFFTVVETDDLHARTLAVNALRRNPEADEVNVSLRCYRLPSMEEYRKGIRPSANEYYWGRFVRRVRAGESER